MSRKTSLITAPESRKSGSRTTQYRCTVGVTKAQLFCAMIEPIERAYLNKRPETVFDGNQQHSCFSLLNQDCTTTGCSTKPIDQLQVRGKNAQYGFSTINNISKWRTGIRFSKRKTSFLKTSSLSGDRCLRLPEWYRIDEFSVTHNSSLTMDDLEVWNHLK